MNKHSLSSLSILALCGAALFGATATASADFTGHYDVSNWSTLKFGNGYVDTSGAPSTITVVGSDNYGGFGYIDFYIQADQLSNVSFSWAYSSPDLPGYDSALYYTDDTGYVPLADTSGASGTVSFTLSAGEYMGFSVESLDSSYGPGALTIRDFEVEAVPEPATMAALGLGLAAVSRRRRK